MKYSACSFVRDNPSGEYLDIPVLDGNVAFVINDDQELIIFERLLKHFQGRIKFYKFSDKKWEVCCGLTMDMVWENLINNFNHIYMAEIDGESLIYLDTMDGFGIFLFRNEVSKEIKLILGEKIHIDYQEREFLKIINKASGNYRRKFQDFLKLMRNFNG